MRNLLRRLAIRCELLPSTGRKVVRYTFSRIAQRRLLYGIALLLALLIIPTATWTDGSPPEDPDADSLSFLAGPERVEGEGWRIRWHAVPDREYRLRYSTNLFDWDTVVTLPASDEVLEHIHALPDSSLGFWKVQLLDDDGGVIGETPVLDNLIASLTLVEGEPTVVLSVDAAAPDGIQDVIFFEGPTDDDTDELLGAADPVTNAVWALSTAAPTNSLAVRYFRALATSTVGNMNELVRGFSLFDTHHYARLDANGDPQLGRAVAIRDDGSLEPFAYLPDGPDGPVLVFPDGAVPQQDAEGWFWTYENVEMHVTLDGDWTPV